MPTHVGPWCLPVSKGERMRCRSLTICPAPAPPSRQSATTMRFFFTAPRRGVLAMPAFNPQTPREGKPGPGATVGTGTGAMSDG